MLGLVVEFEGEGDKNLRKQRGQRKRLTHDGMILPAAMRSMAGCGKLAGIQLFDRKDGVDRGFFADSLRADFESGRHDY